MNFAKQLADRFWENTEYSIGNPDGLFDAAKNECDKLKKNAHKAIFISRLIELISKDADDHARNCSTQPKEDCDTTQNYNHLLFFLTQEFDEFSYQGKDEIEIISYDERNDLNKKLDIIIKELEKLKIDSDTLQKGQAIIIEAFTEEFDELKSLYHLGKKNWRQTMFGKFGEMVASGIVSDTISKEVVSMMKEMGLEVNQLLTNN